MNGNDVIELEERLGKELTAREAAEIIAAEEEAAIDAAKEANK